MIVNEPDRRPCDLPPPGWYCLRGGGHPGPCPAWPTLWTRIKARVFCHAV